MTIDWKKSWWKILTVFLMVYTIIGGFLGSVPRLPILNETIRNLYFHVPMWFGMTLLLLGSFVASIKFLRSKNMSHDIWAEEYIKAGLMMGIAGLLTGMVWAKFTWNTFWTSDPKLNASALGMAIYAIYFLLRNGISDQEQRGKISAIYSLIAFVVFNLLIFVLPRLKDSLHPGNGGNPGFNAYDLNSDLRKYFYTAVIGWSLLGYWLTEQRVRIRKLLNRTLPQL